MHAGARDERRRSLHHRELHPGQRLRSKRGGPCAVPLAGVWSCPLCYTDIAVAMLPASKVINSWFCFAGDSLVFFCVAGMYTCLLC